MVLFLIPVEYTRYKIANEKRKEFENAYTKAEHSLKASSHCLQYELSNCVEKPEYYVLRMEWDSLEGHMNGFRESTEFQTFFEAVRPFFNDIQEMNHYEIKHNKQ